MERDSHANPYSPPGSDVNAGLFSASSDVELAERGTRLIAVTLDGLLACIPFLPMLGVGIYFLSAMDLHSFANGGSGNPDLAGMDDPQMLALIGISTGVGMLGMLGLFIYQWVLISRTGQSLGKKWTGIRIELVDGNRIGFASGVVLRNWVPKLMGVLPYLGFLFQLADILFIFRQDRRCIHDHIAGTRVVRHKR